MRIKAINSRFKACVCRSVLRRARRGTQALKAHFIRRGGRFTHAKSPSVHPVWRELVNKSVQTIFSGYRIGEKQDRIRLLPLLAKL